MTQETIKTTILFADVAGSTRLYDAVGDEKAQKAISLRLAKLTEITESNNGVVVKTIGDEVMARFESADAAMQAASFMQQCISTEKYDEYALHVHIGFHYGEAILEEGDVFGDAVNVAAAITSIAKSKQVMTTEDTVNHMSDANKSHVRKFDHVSFKGKKDETIIFEVIWGDDEEITGMATTFTRENALSSVLRLRYKDKEQSYDKNTVLLHVGRGSNADFTVDTKLASRSHVKIEFRRGKFVLVDESTNGTYVRTQDGKEVYLRREQIPLWGTGVFTLGQAVDKDEEELIYFLCI